MPATSAAESQVFQSDPDTAARRGPAGAILIISPEPWSAHTVSKHHYAVTLAARGFKVFFLNPPENGLEEISIEPVDDHPGLHVVSAPRVAVGLRFYPSSLRRWLETRWLLRLERAVGCRIDALWLFENSRFYDMRFAGNRLKIYHQVDLNQDFNPEQAASTADICFCTSDFIQARLSPHTSGVYKIHHGLALSPDPAPLCEAQLDLFEVKGPHAVYIGNLEMQYLDAELLADLAKRFTWVQFHFVGRFTEDGRFRAMIRGLPNVAWWGKVDSRLIPAILDRADILLVAYQARRYKEQLSSPHKFMEYLGSGKTIVATYTDEYKDKRHLLEMVDDSKDYPAIFERVARNLAEYNSSSRQSERKAFAQAHTYEAQLDRIFDLLRQHRLIAD